MISQIRPVDLHVGQRIRTRRRMMNMSQGDLAKALGITFQQVQKYERGANRVSASRLVDVGQALGVSIAWFFDGLDTLPADDSFAPGEARRLAMSQDYDVAKLLDALADMSHGTRKAALRSFMVSLDAIGEIVKAARQPRRVLS